MAIILKTKLLTPTAKAPTIANPGEDLGYDLYSDEGIIIPAKGNSSVRTGIAVELGEYHISQFSTNLFPGFNTFTPYSWVPFGGVIRDRSSMGKKRIKVMGGEIDAGYRGEIIVMLENFGDQPYEVKQGDKIAQLRPVPVYASYVEVVETLSPTVRDFKGFGSSGV